MSNAVDTHDAAKVASVTSVTSVTTGQQPGYPSDSMAAGVFGNYDTDVIVLCGPFVATDRKGVSWGVKSVHMEAGGFIPDVSVNLDRDGAFVAQLADDDTFTNCVMSALAKIGYTGSSFGRCELGMQGDRCVMLEPCKEFRDFAVSKGFALETFEDEGQEA